MLLIRRETHAAVGREQARLGLNNPEALRGMTAAENIRLNADTLARAGVPEHVIRQLMREATQHASDLTP